MDRRPVAPITGIAGGETDLRGRDAASELGACRSGGPVGSRLATGASEAHGADGSCGSMLHCYQHSTSFSGRRPRRCPSIRWRQPRSAGPAPRAAGRSTRGSHATPGRSASGPRPLSSIPASRRNTRRSFTRGWRGPQWGDQPLIEAFEDSTGIDVNLYRASASTVLQRTFQESEAGFEGGADVLAINGPEMTILDAEGPRGAGRPAIGMTHMYRPDRCC